MISFIPFSKASICSSLEQTNPAYTCPADLYLPLYPAHSFFHMCPLVQRGRAGTTWEQNPACRLPATQVPLGRAISECFGGFEIICVLCFLIILRILTIILRKLSNNTHNNTQSVVTTHHTRAVFHEQMPPLPRYICFLR